MLESQSKLSKLIIRISFSHIIGLRGRGVGVGGVVGVPASDGGLFGGDVDFATRGVCSTST